MKLKTYILLSILTFFSLQTLGQTTIQIPKKFDETEVPKVNSKEWFSLNHSIHKEYGVKIVDGKLEIKKVHEINLCKLKISNGTLIGVNHGEWGGELIFKPDDTTKKIVEIKGGNISFIFKFKNRIYFLEGLAHLSMGRGALYELDTANDSFIVKQIIDFEDAPEAFTIYQDKFLIVTANNFFVVKDLKKELVFKDTFWGGLYPNSIAAFDERNVFIGMRGGIVKLDLTEKTMRFYK